MTNRDIVTFVYILISLVFLYLVPPERIDSRETFAALTGEALFGRARRGEALAPFCP